MAEVGVDAAGVVVEERRSWYVMPVRRRRRVLMCCSSSGNGSRIHLAPKCTTNYGAFARNPPL